MLLVGGVWFSAALSLVGSGVLLRANLPLVPLLILVPSAWLVVSFRKDARFRAWVDALPLKLLVLYHVIRAPLGAYFLQLEAQGALDPVFAELAGYGDILAGVVALLVAFGCSNLTSRLQRFVLWFWNALALLDILAVVVTAQYVLFFGNGMRGLERLVTLPLGLVPLIIVPGVLVTHFLIFWRLRRLPGA